MPRRCDEEFTPDRHRQLRSLLARREVDTTTQWYTYVDFWLLENVSDAQVDYQILQLNKAFGAGFSVPTLWTSVMGDFKIIFEKGDIHRISGGPYADMNDMLDMISANHTTGRINAYYVSFTDPDLLGQAAFESDEVNTAVAIRYDTIDTSPFSGLTLAHEIGHIFGLPHPFSGGCSNQAFADIPSTKTPNYYCISDGTLDNGNLDELGAAAETPFKAVWSDSAWTTVEPELGSLSCGTGREMGNNIMDYALDDALLLFSADQVAYGRAYIARRDLTMRTTAGTVEANVDDAPKDLNGSSSSGLAAWAIALIVVVSVLVVAVIVLVLVRWWRGSYVPKKPQSVAAKV